MTAIITPLMLLYIAAMYCLRKGEHGRIVDALAANWFINQALVMSNVGYPHYLIGYCTIDFITGFWLMTWEGGKAARRAAIFFIPMLALNAAVYASGGSEPWWHYGTLFALAALQLGMVGAMDDGIRKVVDSALCSVRHPVSSAAYYFRGRK